MEIPSELLTSEFLRKITDDFSDARKFGEGEFGVVYKGRLLDGTEIAVKRLQENSAIFDKQFQNEVESLTEARHENVVRLIGYCYETEKKVVEHNGKYIITETVEKLLCHEYMSNGSLDNHLFAEPCGLNWDTRYEIIKGICAGLQFLHCGSQRTIIHLDLKPGNILLDENMVPKIANFGLSRLFGQEQTRTCTQNVVGAIGYMAPEYLCRGEIYIQTDTYSLGLLIIEIVTGEKNCATKQDMTATNFIQIVRQNWTNMAYIALKYPSLDEGRYNHIRRCIDIGLNCVKTNPMERPSINDIIRRLG